MQASAFCERHSSGAYRWADVMSEVRELVSARSRAELVEEFWDVVMTFQLWLLGFGVDLPLVMPRRHHWKFERRRARWMIIFAREGLRFSPKYLRNGGNYKKAHKVRAALEMARAEQG